MTMQTISNGKIEGADSKQAAELEIRANYLVTSKITPARNKVALTNLRLPVVLHKLQVQIVLVGMGTDL